MVINQLNNYNMRMREQLELLKRYLGELQRRLETPSADIYALERLAELTAQSLIDLAAMYLVARRGEKPPTYRALLEEFGRELGLEPQRLGAVAAMRNLLIHRYYSLNVEREVEAFRELVDIVPEAIRRAETLLGDPCLEDARRLGPVFERHDVAYAYLFGSTARKGCGRDLDIAVKFKTSKSLWQLAELARDIEDFLDLPDGAADVVDLDDVPPHFLLSILERYEVIYGDVEGAIAYLARRYLEALDLLVTYRKAEG